MPNGKDNKPHKVTRKRKKYSKKSTDQPGTDNQSTAGSSSKQDTETGEELVKPPKQLKIEKPTKEVQGTDDDSFEVETTDDSDLPSYNRPFKLNEPTEDDSINIEESLMPESPHISTPNEMQNVKSETGVKQHAALSSISEESNPDDPSTASQLKSETEVKQYEPLSSVSEESNPDDLPTTSRVKSETENKQGEPQTLSVPGGSNIDDSTTDRQSEINVTQPEPQTSSSVPGELKRDDSSATNKEKEQQKIESAGKLEAELDTDASSTITCSSKGRGFSDTNSDKESSDSEGSKGVSVSSGNRESECGSIYSYPASDESGPPSVASSVPPLDSRSADQENTSESQGEGNVQENNPNVPAFMLKKYKEFSSSSSSDNRHEES